MNTYTVINADIQASRKLHDYERHEWQLFLKSAIVQINEEYQSAIEAQFMITKGDEFQGVLKSIADVSGLMLYFEKLLYPLHLRFGVGCGAIQKMGSTIPIEMDGQAFHLASEALTFAKKKKLGVYMKTQDEAFDISMNTIYQLIFSIKNHWKEINYKRYWKYKEAGTCKQVAQEERVSTQAVWDSLHNSGAFDIIKVEQSLERLLALRLLRSQAAGK